MGEFRPPTLPTKAGDLVPRCRQKHVANPEKPCEEWTLTRCTRPDHHRGQCAIKVRGQTRMV